MIVVFLHEKWFILIFCIFYKRLKIELGFCMFWFALLLIYSLKEPVSERICFLYSIHFWRIIQNKECTHISTCICKRYLKFECAGIYRSGCQIFPLHDPSWITHLRNRITRIQKCKVIVFSISHFRMIKYLW